MIEEIKSRVDLHDCAARLDLKRPGKTGNYQAPNRDDKKPSLSIFGVNGKAKWKDHTTGAGGDAIDLVAYTLQIDTPEAINWLCEQYGIERHAQQDSPKAHEPKSQIDYIADLCLKNAESARDYLNQRCLTDEMITRAIKSKTIGFNDWRSTKVPQGETGHGGPAAAFIVRDYGTNKVVAVDKRYLDPALNGGIKAQCHGEKNGYPWASDWQSIRKSKTVYIVESPINALSVECCNIPLTGAIATRGVTNIESIDWSFLQGKKVVIGMDNDTPDAKGYRPGTEAAWKIYDELTSLLIPCLIIDQAEWLEQKWNDLNDILCDTDKGGLDVLKKCLEKMEPWAIVGNPCGEYSGKRRIFLPEYDFQIYWRYRVRPDFTQIISKSNDDEGNEIISFSDVSGFRIASIKRVEIASANATMTGTPDSNSRELTAVIVQSPGNQFKLKRSVIREDQLHSKEWWSRHGGTIFKPAEFLRLINIVERTGELAPVNASNFVGLCFHKGKLIVNEGSNTFFTEPEKQCPYHGLVFPSGTVGQGVEVVNAYHRTFQKNAALFTLTWALGGHLKVLLDFWPHLTMEANKGAGKSTLIKRLESTIAFQMLSGQSLGTEFRLLTSVSHTSHPIGWEELSARSQKTIDSAVSILQEAYGSTLTRRGSDMTEFLISAPVLLAGEDVKGRVESILGKIVSVDLSGRKGEPLPMDLPQFPIRQWLEFLAKKTKKQIIESFDRSIEYCSDRCSAETDDASERIVKNFAAVLTAWGLLCEFLSLEKLSFQFADDLIESMNNFLMDSESNREPWVWVMDIVNAEINAGIFRQPYCFKEVDIDGSKVECIFLRPNDIMSHISTAMHLRGKYDSLPVKSGRVLTNQLEKHKIIVEKDAIKYINGKRYSRMKGLSLIELERYGIYFSPPAEDPAETQRNPEDYRQQSRGY